MKTITPLISMAISLSLVCGTVAQAQSAADAPRVLVRVWQAEAPLAGGLVSPTLELDYGAFRWIEVSADEAARLAAVGADVQIVTDPYVLTLGEQRFDPLAGVPAPPRELSYACIDGPDLRLVQFRGPTQPEWLDRLEGGGLRIVQYVHPFTYIVWGPRDALQVVAADETVRWSGDFAPGYRLLPHYRGSAGVQDVRILIVRAAGADAVVAALNALGAQVGARRVLNDRFEVAAALVDGGLLPLVAATPGVYSVQIQPTDGGLRGEMSNQVCVNNVDGNNLAFPGYMDYLAGIGLSGAGVLIANVDGGIYDSHPDLVGQFAPCNGQSCGGSGSGHGTHTAGIMAAHGGSGQMANGGFLRGLGMAPGAKLVEQRYSPMYTEPGGMLRLMTESQRNGASLSGNSWGPSGTPKGYDNDTMQVDIGVRDADPDAPGNQPLSFVLSIMNGNGGTSTQGTPDEGKNIFTIGSTKMQNNNGSQILAINDLSSNTAHGPCLDGRKIPHMVAPGCEVDSSYGASGWDTLCGTSMASPHVSGAVALFIEHYRQLPDYVEDPSPALVKAAFLPTAHDLAGRLDADGGVLGHPFDSKQGWGRLDVDAVINPGVSVRYFDAPVVLNNTGEQWVQTIAAADPTKPLRIMLVWTDAHGHGLGGSTPAWNNDLDLIVEDGPNVYRGNVFGPNGYSITGGTADNRNNTEGVFIGPTANGSYTVRVVAANINSDGVPNFGDGTDQDFAIVCYNAALEPSFTMTFDHTLDSICTPGYAEFTLNVGQIMDFQEPVFLTINDVPPGASAYYSVNPVVPPGQSVLSVTSFATPPGDYTINITGVAAGIERNASVTVSVYNAAPAAVALQSPANGATGLSLRPQFTWSAAEQAATYDLQVAKDAGFTNLAINEPGLTGTSYTPQSDLAIGQVHYWRVRAVNPCGIGAWSPVFQFETRFIPAILLVDDDDNSPDVRSYYTAALGTLTLDYDLWDTNNTDNEPNAAQLSPYSIVVWFTGDEFGGTCGPGAAGEAALASFLNTGKNLLIVSQDYHYDRGLTTFMTGYLGVSSVTNDISQTSVTGNNLFAGLGPYSLSYPFTNWSDRITPNANGVIAFTGNQGTAAVYSDRPQYRTVFMAFPLEAIPTPAARAAVMQRVLEWFRPYVDCNENGLADHVDIYSNPALDQNGNGIIDSCEAVPGDLNGDGCVNQSDLGILLSDFGCAGGGCAGDADGDGDTDQADLGILLSNFNQGPNCP
ncbi:MAG: S8 family serine peptidase [Phycisphaerae bacterium]|nr:S8 family serine peptidase [Phycisphaerae bacterium]MCZ2399712.1 S8 family serine peptidase [Phycisphaerae bacterium]